MTPSSLLLEHGHLLLLEHGCRCVRRDQPNHQIRRSAGDELLHDRVLLVGAKGVSTGAVRLGGEEGKAREIFPNFEERGLLARSLRPDAANDRGSPMGWAREGHGSRPYCFGRGALVDGGTVGDLDDNVLETCFTLAAAGIIAEEGTVATLGVSATIHPLDLSLVLVAVETEAGAPLSGLSLDNFHALLWASLHGGPAAGSAGNFPALVLVERAKELPFAGVDAGFFYELKLGNAVGTSDDIPWAAPVADMGPIVYAVTVEAGSDHGQAIACACHPPIFPGPTGFVWVQPPSGRVTPRP